MAWALLGFNSHSELSAQKATNDVQEEVLSDALASWRERALRAVSLHYRIEGTVTWKRGSFGGGASDVTSVAVPAQDTAFPFAREIWIEPQTLRARIFDSTQQFSPELNEFVLGEKLYAYDGHSFSTRIFSDPTSRILGEEPPITVTREVNGDGATFHMLLDRLDYAMLAAHGHFMDSRSGANLKLETLSSDLNLRVLPDASVDPSQVVLRFSHEGTGKPKSTTIVCDSLNEYRIVRYDYGTDDLPLTSVSFEYGGDAETNADKITSGICREHSVFSGLLRSTRVFSVKDSSVNNSVLSEHLLVIEPTPGEWSLDLATNRRFKSEETEHSILGSFTFWVCILFAAFLAIGAMKRRFR